MGDSIDFEHNDRIGDRIRGLWELARDEKQYVPVGEIHFSRIGALCQPLNVLKHLIYQEHWADFPAYDESKRMVGMKILDDLLVSREDFVALQDGSSQRGHYKFLASNVFYLGKQAQVRPPKNSWWRVKNWFGSYQLDWDRAHFFAFPFRGTDEVLTLWENDRVLPIYDDNPDYAAIRRELFGRRKGQ